MLDSHKSQLSTIAKVVCNLQKETVNLEGGRGEGYFYDIKKLPFRKTNTRSLLPHYFHTLKPSWEKPEAGIPGVS